jgi:hypothetical protein
VVRLAMRLTLAKMRGAKIFDGFTQESSGFD